MKFNCDTQNIGFCDSVFETTSEQSVEADIILPDYCPEIQKILRCSVQPEIKSVQNSSGRITAEGNAVIRLFYLGDNGKLAAYEQSYPIRKFVESNKITHESAATVGVNVDYVNCRAVSPRRADVRGMLTFVFSAYTKREENILNFADGCGIMVMTDDCTATSVRGVCEKSFYMSEVIDLPEKNGTVSQIVNVSPFVCASEIKCINNKALIKGECSVKIYYLCDENGTVESFEHSMPVSQIIELDGLNENCVSSISLKVMACEAAAKSDSSGDMRLIDLNMRISAFAVALEENPLTLITDAYSTDYELKTSTKNIEIAEYNDKTDFSFTNKVVFESIGVSVDCVIAVWCSDIKYSFAAKDGKFAVGGTYQATVIYRDADNQLGIIQKPVDFDYSAGVPVSSDRILCYGSVAVSGCSCALTGDSRIELKTEIYVSAVVLSSAIKKYISAIEISENEKQKEKPCALTVYYCEKGEKIWDIAKKYGTTVEAVMVENDIVSPVAESHRMLLIPGV